MLRIQCIWYRTGDEHIHRVDDLLKVPNLVGGKGKIGSPSIVILVCDALLPVILGGCCGKLYLEQAATTFGSLLQYSQRDDTSSIAIAPYEAHRPAG